MTIEKHVPGQRTEKQIALLLIQAVLGTLGLFLILSALLERPLWELGGRVLLTLLMIGFAYGAVVFGILLVELLWRKLPAFLVALIAIAAAVPALAAFVVLRPPINTGILLGGLAVALLLVVATFMVQQRHVLKLGVAAAAFGAGALLHAAVATGVWQKSLSVVLQQPASYIGSSLYNLEVTSFRGGIPHSNWIQGGVTMFGDRYLATTADGRLYAFRRGAAEDGLELERLPYSVPINIDDFEVAAAGLLTLHWFRVAHLLAGETPNGLRLFVTHHFWDVQEQCWVMRVSSLEGRFEEFLAPSAPLAWSTVYETAPCMPLAASKDEPIRFVGLSNAGRLTFLGDNQLLVTVGDHEMDGWPAAMVSQDPEGSYGKTILIDLDDLSHEIYTTGHRNAQGLHVSDSGRIWSTEHGPQGGDELNLIERGANYGWPLATYGTEYGTNSWPLTSTPGGHEGFQRPFYSWIPSIGVSAVLEVTSPRFAHWRGDLLVGSLRAQTLWRLRIRDDRVVLAEQIPVGMRIRDLIEGHDGELVMWTDANHIHFIVPSEEAATGEYVYRACASCHVPPPGLTTAVGPPLSGILDREVAASPGFDYSPALRDFGGRWTRERLDAYLADPLSVVPGTTMYFNGLQDREAREALLDYLVAPDSRLDVMPNAPL